jgi:hypothetical protein
MRAHLFLLLLLASCAQPMMPWGGPRLIAQGPPPSCYPSVANCPTPGRAINATSEATPQPTLPPEPSAELSAPPAESKQATAKMPLVPSPASGQSPAPQTPDVPLNVLGDREFLATHPDFVSTTRKILESQGYICPNIVVFLKHGMTSEGAQMEIKCAPAGGNPDDYSYMHYMLYSQTLRVHQCKWGVLPNPECD